MMHNALLIDYTINPLCHINAEPHDLTGLSINQKFSNY